MRTLAFLLPRWMPCLLVAGAHAAEPALAPAKKARPNFWDVKFNFASSFHHQGIDTYRP
jgi:hypothetical protein